jgi:hypothetical protein
MPPFASARLPLVLSRDEARALLAQLDGRVWLVGVVW